MTNEITKTEFDEIIRQEGRFKFTPGTFVPTHDCGTECEVIVFNPLEKVYRCPKCGNEITVGNVWD